MANEVIAGCGLHHISIKVKDFEKSVVFYEKGLGFKKVIAWGTGDKRGIMLDIGDGSCIEIFAGGSQTELPDGKWNHLAFRTTDCDGAFNAAVTAGAVADKAPYDIDIPSSPVYKVRIAFVKGFDGELIEFFQDRK